MKPMLASDWDQTKVRFPVIAQPKIDGVRALNMSGTLTGRSLKLHKNKHVTTTFSTPLLAGMDGEMAAESDTHPSLCRLTSSALGTIEGQPWILWWLFDYINDLTLSKPYVERLHYLEHAIEEIRQQNSELGTHLRIVPSCMCENMDELLAIDDAHIAKGYEGTIIRDPFGLHKQGRSTVREGGLLRIKRFVDFEFRVTEILEGEENLNEAQINELGQTFRSSHQANKVPNGMVGAMLGRVIGEVKDASGNVVMHDGQEVKVGAGRLTHDQRRHYFINQDELKMMICKGKFFPVGIKDKLRFPTWQSFRSEEDL